MKDSFAFLFFRRMRAPLIVLIAAYSIATVGFTLMPGVDDQGDPWRLSLFEAFYVVSYTGSTIGFGEIPYDFTPAQRLWTMVSIYLTVIAWLFSIGTIVSLLQDPAFRRAAQRARFRRAIARINEPFYLVCGYGDTGRILTRALSDQRHCLVVIDHDPHKIEALSVDTHRATVASFCMDASVSDNLVQAGLRSRWCLGVLAVTGEDRVNLKIAITAKLLNRHSVVHARAETGDAVKNMQSFETDHVVNPIEEYIHRLRLAIERPQAFRLHHWLQSGPDAQVPELRHAPRGRWILCGFGALGRAMHATLCELGMEVTVIEEDSAIEDLPEGTIEGRGTRVDTLRQAGIETARGLLVTTRDDFDNLSILMTAREFNESLFCAVVENGLSSHAMYREVEPDLLGQPSRVIAGNMLSRIRSRLIGPFFDQLLEHDERTCGDLLERLVAHQSGSPPELFTIRISERRAPAIASLIEQGRTITLEIFSRDPAGPNRRRPVDVLMLRRDDHDYLLPDSSTELARGDRILLAGRHGSGRRLRSIVENENALTYVLTGREIHQGWVWNWLARRMGRAAPGRTEARADGTLTEGTDDERQ